MTKPCSRVVALCGDRRPYAIAILFNRDVRESNGRAILIGGDGDIPFHEATGPWHNVSRRAEDNPAGLYAHRLASCRGRERKNQQQGANRR